MGALDRLAHMTETPIPEGLTPDYENEGVQNALTALQEAPDYEHLAAFLTALRSGFLIVDVTGSPKKKGTRARTTRTTKGQLVLPIFTSMHELRAAVGSGGRQTKPGEAKGAFLPAVEALQLIESDRFVAAELNPGGNSLVVLRKYITLAASNDPITPEVLEKMKQ